MSLAIAPDWQNALKPVLPIIEELMANRTPTELPAQDQVLRAFELPMSSIKAVIVGQDPYPTPGDANGLAFSVSSEVKPLPPTLRNILTEYVADTGYPMPQSGDLSSWSRAGVLLLNRCLSVESGAAGSLRASRWKEVTASALEILGNHNPDVVAILWGKDAESAQGFFQNVISSPHPSPLSAYRGFFGSRPFTRTNQLLGARGVAPIEWRLP